MSEIILSPRNLPDRVDLLARFADFLRLDVAQGDASPETLRTYHAQVGQFVAWCDREGFDPAAATVDDLKAYRAAMVEAGYKRTTIGTKLAAVRRLYDACVWAGVRPDNPAKGLQPPKEKTARHERVKWLPLAAIDALLKAPPATPAGRRDRAQLALMAIHGLRVIEVARLDLAALDLDGKTLTVLGKGDKVRTVYLIDQTIMYLRAWLELRPDVAQPGEAAVFVSLSHGGNVPAGGRMSTRALRAITDGYLKALGLKREGVSCHSLRHSFGTLSYAAGANLMAISRAMGHSSVITTQVYVDIKDANADNPAIFLVGALEQVASG